MRRPRPVSSSHAAVAGWGGWGLASQTAMRTRAVSAVIHIRMGVWSWRARVAWRALVVSSEVTVSALGARGASSQMCRRARAWARAQAGAVSRGPSSRWLRWGHRGAAGPVTGGRPVAGGGAGRAVPGEGRGPVPEAGCGGVVVMAFTGRFPPFGVVSWLAGRIRRGCARVR
jgi:hypothetical protein